VAIVSAGDVRTPAAQASVERVAAELRVQPDVATVVSFYETHDPAMVSRDRYSTYVVAYFKPRSDTQLQDAAQRIEDHFAGQRDVRLGGVQIESAQENKQIGFDLAPAARIPVHLLALAAVLPSLVASLIPPLLGGLAIPGDVLRCSDVSSFADLSVFALSLVTGLESGSRSTTACSWSRATAGSRRQRLRARRHRRTLETSGRTILFSSLTVAVRSPRCDLPAAIHILDGVPARLSR
jgi:RND superfamily putative drug exporter